MRAGTAIKVLHFDMTVTLNDTSWSWNDPRVTENLSFSMPAALFDEKTFGKLIAEQLENMKKKFPEAVLEYEARKAKEEAEKAEKEKVNA